MQHCLKSWWFVFIFLGSSQLNAQDLTIGKNPVDWNKITEQQKLAASLLWLEKQAIRAEIKSLTFDLLKYSVTYTDVFNILQISRWDAGIMRTIPSLVPIRQAKIKDFRVSSGFGYRKHPIKKSNLFHGGIDIPAPHGTAVFAVADAVVTRSIKHHESLGNFVQLNHLNGFITMYGHLLHFIVVPGQTVKQGQVIGFVGQSGLSTGNHLHYILIKNGLALDPYPFCFLMFEKFKAIERNTYSSGSK